MAGSASMKRIRREILDLSKLSQEMGDITLNPTERSIYEWKATIPGPTESPYAGGIFNLSISLPNDYPFSAPKVVFTTPVYHPNVSPQGAICVDVLKNSWSPALSLYKVMLSLSSLLTDPNPNDPLVPAIAQEYLKRRPAFDKKAREWTAKYAMPQAKDAAPEPMATPAPSMPLPRGSGILASLVSFATGRSAPSSPAPTPLIPTAATTSTPAPLPTARSTRSARNVPTRAAAATSSTNTEVIDLDDDSDMSTPAPSASGRKRKRDEEDDESETNVAGEPSDSRQMRRRNPTVDRRDVEVIVLDDD